MCGFPPTDVFSLQQLLGEQVSDCSAASSHQAPSDARPHCGDCAVFSATPKRTSVPQVVRTGRRTGALSVLLQEVGGGMAGHC